MTSLEWLAASALMTALFWVPYILERMVALGVVGALKPVDPVHEVKQALLGDLATASYAQLVEAAELCPARCIHPGKPWNPDEPGLQSLIERAAPFNR